MLSNLNPLCIKKQKKKAIEYDSNRLFIVLVIMDIMIHVCSSMLRTVGVTVLSVWEMFVSQARK